MDLVELCGLIITVKADYDGVFQVPLPHGNWTDGSIDPKGKCASGGQLEVKPLLDVSESSPRI